MVDIDDLFGNEIDDLKKQVKVSTRTQAIMETISLNKDETLSAEFTSQSMTQLVLPNKIRISIEHVF